MKMNKNGFCLLTTVTLMLSAFLVVGCVATKEQFIEEQMANGVQPLTKDELVELYSNAMLSGKTSKIRHEEVYSADGTINGKAWGDGWTDDDVGTWRVTDDNLICNKWSKWGEGVEGCAAIYPTPGGDNYTAVKKIGKHSKAYPSGIIPIKITKQ